ncbi:hypothetical protein D3C79_1019090 [compost metagenome]
MIVPMIDVMSADFRPSASTVVVVVAIVSSIACITSEDCSTERLPSSAACCIAKDARWTALACSFKWCIECSRSLIFCWALFMLEMVLSLSLAMSAVASAIS